MVTANHPDALARLAGDDSSLACAEQIEPWTPGQDKTIMNDSPSGHEMSKFPSDKMSVVDLFAGCGGFALGLEQSGFFAPAYVNELNDHARGNYLLNQPPRYEWLQMDAYRSSDVRDLTRAGGLSALRKALMAIGIDQGRPDLVVGGPPCQGFSGIGHRRSYKVEKEDLPSNFLYKEMIKIIKGLRPRAFVFENVKGVLTGRWNATDEPRSIWRDLSRDFHALEKGAGYRVAAALLHAKHYGVPQNRPRLLIVGIHEDALDDALPFSKYDSHLGMPLDAIERGFLPQPNRQPPNLRDLLGDLDDANYEIGATVRYLSEPSGIQRAFRERRDGSVMGKGAELSNQQYSKHSAEVRRRFEEMHAYATKGLAFPRSTKKFAQRVLRATWGDGSEPDFTVTSLPDDYVHYAKPRTLTVREWARLQTFPDWYRFTQGPRTTGGLRRAGNPMLGIYERELPHYTQIGNAVPVWLAEAVGRHIGTILKDRGLPQ